MRVALPVLVCCYCLAAFPSLQAGDSNIALTRPVVASGAVPAGTPASNVTDGDSSTYTAPTTAGVAGFYYQIDLGKEYPIQAIDLYSRVNDATNKLSKVRMGVYSDNGGVPGTEQWGYEIRADGSNNIQGGVDHLVPSLHPAGNMKGRFVRLTNVANASNAPQIAEIEVFEAPLPTVKYFGTDVGNITKIGTPGMPTQAVLTWNIAGYTSLSLDQGIGNISGPSGSVTVSPNTTTTYTLTATNGAGVLTRTVTIGVDAAELPPFISEFLASNVGGIKDSNGARQDWIEIGNPNAFAINLSGYYLTDNAANKTKWQFPAFTVPGNGYAIVFASNATTPSPAFETPHTNFSLSAGGEYLGLIAKNGTTVISQFPSDFPTTALYPPQESDHSYGISGGLVGFFPTPTPNEPNGTRFDGVVADTSFSALRGFYSAPIDVTITCATPGAEIRYTLDGATPTETTGSVYAGPISISTTKVLKAAAFKSGWAPTNVDTQTYVFTADVKSSASGANGWLAPTLATNLTNEDADLALKEVPSMSLTVGPSVTIDGGVDKLATLEWLDPTGLSNGFQIPCGVQLFGGAFTNFAKKSFRVSFKGEYGATKLKYPLFAGFDRGFAATDEFDQLELRNGSHDMNARGFYMSNAFTDATMLDMGSYAPHGRFVHLYLNGKYWGLYHLRERFAADMMAAYYGGSDTDYESINGNLNVGGWADPGQPYDGTDAQWTMIKSLARSGGNVYEKLRPYVDIPQYIDYMIMWMFGKSEDEYRTTGPIGMAHGYKFVLNDADGYLPYAPYAGPGPDRTTRDAPGKKAGDGPGSLFSMLYKDGGADYKALLADRIHRAYVTPGGAMTPARNQARLTELCAQIQKSMTMECARWNYQTPTGWAGHRDAAITEFNTRTTTILNVFRNTGFYPTTVGPVFNPAPGTVASGTPLTMSTTTAGGVIYYTLDGTDPRLDSSVPPNTPLVTSSTIGKFHVPSNATDGVVVPDISNLQAYYSLNSTVLEPINGLNGVMTNGATFVSPGKYGGAAGLFDGSNDYMSLGNPDALKITGQITLAAWVRPTAITNQRDIISKGTDTAAAPNGETFLRINAGAYEGGYIINGGTSVLVTGPASGTNSALADVGKYAHVAIVYDGTTWRLYRNGTQINSVASATGAVPASIGWAVGARGSGDARFFNGQIDEVRIYNRGLTPAEIASIANNTATTPGQLWTQTAYDDSTWPTFSGALGFAPMGDALESAITQNISASMSGVNASVYQRYTFNVTNQQKANLQSLQLNLKADDGYAVYLNGNRVAGRNDPTFPSGTATATAETPDATALAGETVDLTSVIPSLIVGNNMLAVQGLNLTAADDDFLLSTQLYGQQGVPGLSLSALTYSSAISLTANTLVKARTYNPTTKEWSGLEQAFYQVGTAACPVGSLAVSELHYNPQGDEDGEFIELMNVSSQAINLRGVSFADGVTFQFPTNRDTPLAPGQRLVLVDSELTFQKIHGWSAPLGGIYNDSFSNSGERVRIVAADQLTTLIDFTYDGAAPWPDAADGGGRSLVLINPSPGIDHNNPANWRVSIGLEGNPNSSDIIAFTGIASTDADGDGLNAALEFALGTSDAAKNVLPVTLSNDPLAGFSVQLEHANGANLTLQANASTDLSLWTVPVELTDRQLLPNGHLLSTWQAVPSDPAPAKLFFRFSIP